MAEPMILTDQPTWDRWNETGEWVLFREGVSETCDHKYYSCSDIGCMGPVVPPAEFVEWAKPCSTCAGLSIVPTPRPVVNGPIIPEYSPCPDCFVGKRRIAVAVQEVRGGEHEGATCWFADVTVGHVVVKWGPTLIDDDNAPQLSALGYEGQYAIGGKVVT